VSGAHAIIVPPTRASGYAVNRFLLTGALLLATLAAIAALGPWIAPHDPAAVEVRRVLGAPDFVHPFGSDVLGRDVLSRVIYGLRVSLLVSESAVVASLAVAAPLGLAAGYFGRWVDTAVSRSLDMILIFPAMLLAVTFIAILGPGGLIAAIAIAVIYLPILARVMRASTLVVSQQEYVAGARARGEPSAGASDSRSAKRARPGHRAGLRAQRLRVATRGRPELSGSWHAAANAVIRRDAGRWPRCADPGALG
jgi:peptide/nickel transport system permease protein